MVGPIEGLRVVDCSRGTAGPRATGMLADYGADVVWVEPPGGDPLRRCAPEAASVFNRGKRSVVLDLHDRDGARAARSRSPSAPTCSSRAGGPASPSGSASATTCSTLATPRLVYVLDLRLRRGPGHRPARLRGDRPGRRSAACPSRSATATGPSSSGSRSRASAPRTSPSSARSPRSAAHSRTVRPARRDVAARRRARVPLDDVGRERRVDRGARKRRSRSSRRRRTRLITRSFVCGDGEYIGLHTGAVGAFGRAMKVLGLDDRVPPSETASTWACR